MIDVSVTFEEDIRWFHLDLARVTLAPEIELDHWNTQELGVTSDIGWHWYFEVLVRVSVSEGLQGLWWVSHCRNWDVLDDQVGIFKIWLGVLGAEEQLKINIFSSRDPSLRWADPVVGEFIFQGNLGLILLFIDAPMERYCNWR